MIHCRHPAPGCLVFGAGIILNFQNKLEFGYQKQITQKPCGRFTSGFSCGKLAKLIDRKSDLNMNLPQDIFFKKPGNFHPTLELNPIKQLASSDYVFFVFHDACTANGFLFLFSSYCKFLIPCHSESCVFCKTKNPVLKAEILRFTAFRSK